MSVDLMEPTVAKEKKPDTSIRIRLGSAEAIKKAATLKGMTIAEYFDDALMPVIKRDLIAEGKKLARGDKPE